MNLTQQCPTLCIALRISKTSRIILGTKRQQKCIFGCIVLQIIATLALISLYYNELYFHLVWWPTIEFVRICILGMIRVDQLIESEPNICFINDDQKLYRAVALMNAFGLIWSFPFWIIYAFASLSNDEQSIIFFVITLIFIIFHIICSLPAIRRIHQSAVQRHSMEQNEDYVGQDFGYSFMSESINDLLSPSQKQQAASPSDNNSDDFILNTAPLLYTAPFGNVEEEEKSNISSMNNLILNKHQKEENNDYRFEEDADISEETEEADGI